MTPSPINAVFIDPTGIGLDDAALRRLRAVFNASIRTAQEVSLIGMRVIVFTWLGFEPANGHEEEVQKLASRVQDLGVMESIIYLRRKIFARVERSQRPELFDKMRDHFQVLGLEDYWSRCINPYREEFLK